MKALVAFLSALLLLLLLPSTVRDAEAGPTGVGERVSLPAGQVIEGDYFAAGRVVEIFGTVNGDVYAAGGQVVVNGQINGDLIAAGGVVSVAGKISQDARLAGGQITVAGEIGRNLTAGTGNLEIVPSAKLRGGLVACAGRVHLGAPVGGDVTVMTGSLMVSNAIGGGLRAAAKSIRLTSGAVVSGDVTTWSDQTASIDEGARIGGTIAAKPPLEMHGFPRKEILTTLAVGVVLAKVIGFVSTLVLGVVMIYFFPKYHQTAVSTLRQRPWVSLGVGFVTFFMIPIAAVVLLATVVGLPLAFLLAGLYLIALYIARIPVIFWAGAALFERFGKTVRAGWIWTAALAAYTVLTLVPVAGALLTWTVLLFGLGAAALTARGFYRGVRT